MVISSALPRPVSRSRSWWQEPLQKLQDVKEGASLLVAGSLYLHNKKGALAAESQHPPLTDVPNVKLERPLVVCPGWNTEHYKFRHLAHKLEASGENGQPVYLKEGHAFADSECSQPLALEQIPSNSKIFVNIWDTVKTPPDQTARQLAQNLDLVHGIAGPGKVDLVGYSMGGLAARKYLDNGGTSIGRLMTLGTPNQGARFAQMANHVVQREVGWAQQFAGLSAADGPALGWLSCDSPTLKDLNSRWPQQRALVEEAITVTGSDELTPSTGWLPYRQGDGMVTPERASLPDTPHRVLTDSPFLHHGTLPQDSKVFQEMSEFFGFQPVPGDYEPPPPIMLDNFQTETPYGSL